jgi:hypothetical protein
MTVEQYSALVEIMPQIESALEKKGEKIPRPSYADAGTAAGEDEAEQQGDVDEAKGDEESVAANGKRKKSNFEATSDEDEDE